MTQPPGGRAGDEPDAEQAAEPLDTGDFGDPDYGDAEYGEYDVYAHPDHLEDPDHEGGYAFYEDPDSDDRVHLDPASAPLPDSRRARREARAARPARPGRSRRRGRRLRRFLVLFLALGMVGGAGYLGFSVLRPLFSGSAEPTDYPGPGTDPVQFVVNPGDTGRAIGSNLEKSGIVKSAQAFVEAASNEPKSAGIQPGQYPLRKQMRAADALAVLVDPKNRQSDKVTIREGLWATEIYAQLAKATGFAVSDYEAAAMDPTMLGLPAGAGGNVEGYLFPATYEFSSKDSPATQLRTMVSKAKAELTKLGIDPDKAQRVVILASIVEAEARRAEDRPKVARVVENRLAAGRTLELDSTVSYAAKKRAITTTDAERASESPWNTYKHQGLPAGPIANPGVSSLQAAIGPAEGPWLYFVAVNPETGETKFATTFEEHQRNVAEFIAWCNKPENQGKCSR